jgi:quinol monooxygenase YgiN
MAQIDVSRECITLINTFDVDPRTADALIALLDDATEQVVRNRPGFLSASIHRSLDGKQVVNYAQWQTLADFEAMRRDPACMEHIEAAAALAIRSSRVLYTVRAVHD